MPDPFTQAYDLSQLALQITTGVSQLWTWHFAVVIGAVGWGVTSYTSKKSAPLVLAVCVGIAVFLFSILNLYSISSSYERLNDVLQLLSATWIEAGVHIPSCGSTPGLCHFSSLFRFNWLVFGGMDVIISVVVAVLMAGPRFRQATHPRPARDLSADTDHQVKQ
ncbi:MAG TPA: hypothetical protein VGG29_04355 [Caulobacteraceae bacterium]